MKIISKKSLTILALGISSCIFAADMDTRVKELEMKMEKVYTKTATGAEGAKTACARPEPQGNGWWINIDVLYWHTKVGGTEFAQTVELITTNSTQFVGTNKEVDLSWDWGFKVGVGYKFDHDGWDTHLEYTYFRPSDSSSVSLSSPSGIYPLKGASNLPVASDNPNTIVYNFCEKATSSLKYNYDNINLELGRDYFVSKNLSFRPHFGLRTTWLNLKQITKFTGGTTVSGASGDALGFGVNTFDIKDKSDFWGLGVRTGVDSKWYLTNGFSLFGDVSGALLYGSFKTRSTQIFTGVPNNILDIKENFHRIVPTANLVLGLAYDQYIYNDKQHIGVSLGYETEYLWSANQMQSPNTNQIPIDYDVSIQGVTLEVRWDF